MTASDHDGSFVTANAASSDITVEANASLREREKDLAAREAHVAWVAEQVQQEGQAVLQGAAQGAERIQSSFVQEHQHLVAQMAQERQQLQHDKTVFEQETLRQAKEALTSEVESVQRQARGCRRCAGRSSG
jgi:hypothetical protein